MTRKRIDELDALAVTDVAVGDLGVIYDLSAAKAKKMPYYATINPWLWPTRVAATSQTLTAADMWKVVVNSGASGNVLLTLPPGVLGYSVLFRNDSNTHRLDIDPHASEIIGYGGPGKYLRMLVRGDILLTYTGSRWDITGDHCITEFEV
jgi:hypothetical protein